MKLEITIGDNEIQVEDPDKIPLAIDYAIEESADFQKKRAAESMDITIPATLLNRQVSNSFHNPSVADLTEGEVFRNPQKAVIKAGGTELLVGKALLQQATHTDRPQDYTYNFFGNNADWMIDLQETTLFDILSQINFPFTKQQVIDSWQFNGRSEDLPFVFAPVRYREAMDKEDYSMLPQYMKPSLSKWYVLYWGLKKAGYKIVSDFLDTDFFKRQIMPWTWGSFLAIDDSRIDNLRFLAKSEKEQTIDFTYTGFWDLFVTNDSTTGGYDNNDAYRYDRMGLAMQWTYLSAFNYGNLDATFKITLSVNATVAANGDNHMWVHWFKNGIPQGIDDVFEQDAPAIGRRDVNDVFNIFHTINVNPGDVVSAKIFIRNHATDIGRANISASVDAFDLEYMRIPLGGTIDFANYSGMKKWKFLDFFRGLIDEFNLIIATDTIKKQVLIEPQHDYILPGETTPRKGFFNSDFIDWSEKLDYSIKATVQLFSDYQREVTFKYKSDSSDGGYKVIQDRYTNTPAAATYVLPDRFKAEKKPFENRFFSASVHYEVSQWKKITGTAPQMLCLIPENISNTSESEAQNTFQPKSAYYKGLVNGLGWVFDGEEKTTFPLMFSVNYMPGGETDPVLSYCDEKIGNDTVGYTIARGLFKKFFWQRMAIIRNGQWHTAAFHLNNTDVSKPWHREHKTYLNQRWELVSIQGYQPLKEDSTKCLLRKWAPLSREDYDNSFPSGASLLNNQFVNAFDTKYCPLKVLSSDIPK